MEKAKCEINKRFCNARKEGYCNWNTVCKKITDKCIECAWVENDYCKAYINPAGKWTIGNCPLATNIVIETKKKTGRMGQQKQVKKK